MCLFVQEKTSEGISKISSVLKDGGEQLSESASKVGLFTVYRNFIKVHIFMLLNIYIHA